MSKKPKIYDLLENSEFSVCIFSMIKKKSSILLFISLIFLACLGGGKCGHPWLVSDIRGSNFNISP